MNVFPDQRFSTEDTIISLLGDILKAHPNTVERFKADLIHDGVWLEKHVFSGLLLNEFYYGVREAGTSIGDDEIFTGYSNDVLYKVTVTRREDGYVLGKAEQIEIRAIRTASEV